MILLPPQRPMEMNLCVPSQAGSGMWTRPMRRRATTVGMGTAAPRGARPEKVRRARMFRQAPTSAEALLWEGLRRRFVAGLRFRRQHIIAGYVVDFYCPSLRLAIEVDGS